MHSKTSSLSKSRLSAGILTLLVLSLTSNVAAQGWHSGGAKGAAKSTAAKPAPAKTTTSPPATKATKPVTSYKGRRSTAKTREKKTSAEAATASTAGTAAAASASRERRVVNTTTSANGSTINAAPTGKCDPEKDQREDLSGIYRGSIQYPNSGMNGEATLTIAGNRFTLDAGAKSESGNITAITTCNYTAVAMMFGEWKTPKPGDPVKPPMTVLSLRATKKGEQLTLKASPSERREFSFEPGPKK
jgi:hypothetical protein